MPVTRDGDRIAERLARSRRSTRRLSNEPPCSVSLADGVPVRLPGDAVDDAAGAAAAEDHRVRALERLDAVDVVEVAEVLDVVAHAVDEEVGGRAVAAEDRRVAVALALRHADARHVAQRRRPCSACVWSSISSRVTT